MFDSFDVTFGYFSIHFLVVGVEIILFTVCEVIFFEVVGLIVHNFSFGEILLILECVLNVLVSSIVFLNVVLFDVTIKVLIWFLTCYKPNSHEDIKDNYD